MTRRSTPSPRATQPKTRKPRMRSELAAPRQCHKFLTDDERSIILGVIDAITTKAKLRLITGGAS